MHKLLFAGLMISTCATVAAQTQEKLGYLIPHMYGSQGLVLPNPFHEAHFLSSFQSSFTPLNASLASQVSALPFASPASGFVYAVNPATGVLATTSESFGPVLTERAETIGRGRVFFGVTFQHFGFDTLDGQDLKNLPAVFTHEHATGPGGSSPTYEQDFITTTNSIDLIVNQYTAFATVGVTDRVDLSIAIPLVNAHLSVNSAATIVRVAPPDPVFGQTHYFDASDPNGSTHKLFASSGTATGLGDIIIRAKWRFYRGERLSLGLAGDFRAPSGDEANFLGSGAAGFRPFVIASYRAARITPHVNLGYEWNGKSVLAGDITTGAKRRLPNQFIYFIGADIGLRRATLAFDFLGQRLFGVDRIASSTYVSATGQQYAQITPYRGSYNMLNGSAGVKFNVIGTLLASANLIFKLNDAGLRAPVVPLIGLSYTF